ncbi:MAG: hypothetical protein V8R50_04305 [Clostridia bacterium]
MTVFKFLFVLALAVPLAVFMWNYINKLSDEFQKSVSRSRGSRRPEQPAGTERSPRPARTLQGPADLTDRRDLQEPADLTDRRELQDPVNLIGRRELQEPVNLTGRRDRKDLIQRKLLQGRCKSLRANGSGARHAKR